MVQVITAHPIEMRNVMRLGFGCYLSLGLQSDACLGGGNQKGIVVPRGREWNVSWPGRWVDDFPQTKASA